MKRVIAFTVMLVMASSPGAFAQASSTVPLADVARREEERRKTTKKATRVITNATLGAVEAPPTAATAAVPKTTPATSGNTSAPIPLGKEPAPSPADKKDQAYWQGRIATARVELSRTQMFADSLQTKINSLRTDFTNRDNRVEREKIQVELNTALAELERLKKELEKQMKNITAIEDEARRAGVPAGWLRSPA